MRNKGSQERDSQILSFRAAEKVENHCNRYMDVTQSAGTAAVLTGISHTFADHSDYSFGGNASRLTTLRRIGILRKRSFFIEMSSIMESSIFISTENLYLKKLGFTAASNICNSPVKSARVFPRHRYEL